MNYYKEFGDKLRNEQYHEALSLLNTEYEKVFKKYKSTSEQGIKNLIRKELNILLNTSSTIKKLCLLKEEK